MRLYIRSVSLVPSTTHFLPSRNTRVFLDKESIDAVSLMQISDNLVSAQTMPVPYQLRRFRSKFHNLSTYIECRALSSLDSLQTTPSQEKIGSILLRSIAVAAVSHDESAVLHLNEVEDLAKMAKDSAIGKILVSIIDIFDQGTLFVIKNQCLNAKLTDLAAAV
ncbi:hypothetical protein CU097_012574 [Rhizopus azygosporus]|uniref:Uncharacterized protein n=1 Tax=Rhizopus azygosporus TaxID=86630 RepID=A0A367JN41_RHIAZ|nr:hypothetical protein CU097_012574 [Rhizopus azygosporus]